jgi:hypothetical protein
MFLTNFLRPPGISNNVHRGMGVETGANSARLYSQLQESEELLRLITCLVVLWIPRKFLAQRREYNFS